jgi:hypothetical protein
MRKYKTTNKHPAYKEDLLIEYKNDEKQGYTEIRDASNCWTSYNYDISECIEKDWIEEIKEKLYTEDDLLSLLEHFDGLQPLPAKLSYETVIKKWKDEKHNK